MHEFWIILGIFVLGAGFVDLFLTALNYDDSGFLVTPLCAVQWRCLRLLTRRLSRRWRPLALRQVTGLQIVLSVTTWLGCVVIGFGFIYYGLMYGTDFQYDGRDMGASVFSAMYLSAAQLSTVGTSQITPETDWLRALTILETLSASLLVTLILTFLFGVFQVVRDLRSLSSNFFTAKDDSGDALASLRPYFPQGQPTGLDGHLQAISGSFWAYADGLRLHHVAYYFQSGRDQFSLPYTLHMMGRTLAALRWGLPAGHPSSQEPTLAQLITQFENFADYLHDQLGWTSTTVPEVVSFDDFSAHDGLGEAGDLWVRRFLRLNRDMATLSGLEVSKDRQEAYERYRHWLPFAYCAEQVAAAVSRDLDYQPVTHGKPGAGGASSEARMRSPLAVTTWPQRWRVFINRWVAVPDPGLTRLMMAAGSTLAAIAAVATVYLLSRFVAAPALPTAMFGGMVGLYAVMMPSDVKTADRQLTTALIVLPAIVGAAVGAAVASSFAVSTAVLVIVVLLGVGVGNLGPRLGALGQMAFMACYFALLLHPGLSALPYFAGAAVVGVIWAYVFRFVFFVEKPERVVRGGLDAFRARLILMLDPLIDAVSAARWDPDVRRRVRADLRQLRRCATFLQGRLRIVDPTLVWTSGKRPGELRLQVFDAELAATNVLAAAREFARAGAEMPVVLRGELAGILDRAQDQLRHQGPAAASNASVPDLGLPKREDRAQLPDRWPRQARWLDDSIGELLSAFGTLSDAQSAALADSAVAAREVADADSRTMQADSASPREASVRSPRSWLLTPTSRRAIQAAVATGLALLIGTLVTSTHQYWAALAAFLVLGGTTTIEETVVKGTERVAGTLIGAVIGFEVAIFTGANPFVVLPLLVVCIFAGMYLRSVSYALMVFWMTIMLALLYELIGELTTETLPVRLGETVIGAVVALAAAALLLPVRTRQKVTRDGVALLERVDVITQACLEHLVGNTKTQTAPSLATQALALEQLMHQLNATAEPLRRAPGALGPQGIERRLTAATALTDYARQLIKVTETFTRDAGRLPASEYTQFGSLTHDNIAALIRVMKRERPGPVHRSEDFPVLADASRQAREADGTERTAAFYLVHINQTVLALIDELTPNVAADVMRPAEA